MSKAILGLFLSMVVVHPARAQAGSPAGFPMKAGTFWIYRGTVKWSEGGDVREQQIDWKVEVTRYAHVGDYEVAVVKGDPGDLVWYQSGKPRGDYLLVREGSKYYRVAIGKTTTLTNFFVHRMHCPLV